jgi:hypothetical protein
MQSQSSDSRAARTDWFQVNLNAVDESGRQERGEKTKSRIESFESGSRDATGPFLRIPCNICWLLSILAGLFVGSIVFLLMAK